MKKGFLSSMFYLLFLAVFLLPSPSFGEEFTKIWGWENSDSLKSIKNTSDGNFIVLGTTRKTFDATKDDLYLAKINPQGIKIWETIIGTANFDSAYEVKQAPDGGFIALGMTNAGVYYPLLAKTDANGSLLWSHLIGIGQTFAYGIDIAQNGDILLTGSNRINSNFYDVYIARTDSYGNIIWEKTFTGTGGNGSDNGTSIKETSNGDIIITGNFFSATAGTSTYIMRTDSVGNKIWDRTYQLGYMRSLYQATDGNFIACGLTNSIGAGSWDIYLLKVDTNGNKIWEKTFGNTGNDNGQNVIPTYDGGIAIIADTGSGVTPTGAYAYLIKTNSSGAEQWSRVFGTGGGSICYSMAETSDGGFIAVGITSAFYRTTPLASQFYLTRVDDLSPNM